MSGRSEVVDAVLRQYETLIDRRVEDLPTPVMLLDLDIVETNIATMAERTSGHVHLRPNAKTHKSAEVARLQIAAGAVGVTTANAWEALSLARAGIDGVLIASPVADRTNLCALAEVARHREILVSLDSLEAAEALSRAASVAGATIGALVDVDVNMHRLGVRHSVDAVALARWISDAPALSFRGLQGWEGHAVLVTATTRRADLVKASRDVLLETRSVVEASGLEVEIMTGGGTTTQEVTQDESVLTEWQAGTYVFMDEAFRHMAPSFVPGGITVATTVLGRHGQLLVLDAGKKEVGVEPWATAGVKDLNGSILDMHENHTLVELAGDSDLGFGDRVELIPGHACATVNLHDAYCVVRDGIVVDVWPILARGPGRATT